MRWATQLCISSPVYEKQTFHAISINTKSRTFLWWDTAIFDEAMAEVICILLHLWWSRFTPILAYHPQTSVGWSLIRPYMMIYNGNYFQMHFFFLQNAHENVICRQIITCVSLICPSTPSKLNNCSQKISTYQCLKWKVVIFADAILNVFSWKINVEMSLRVQFTISHNIVTRHRIFSKQLSEVMTIILLT